MLETNQWDLCTGIEESNACLPMDVHDTNYILLMRIYCVTNVAWLCLTQTDQHRVGDLINLHWRGRPPGKV